MEPIELLLMRTLYDTFPTNVAIGGSFARNRALGLEENTNSDIDIFINAKITRVGLTKILLSLFKGIVIAPTDPEQGHPEYKMPGLVRRIEAEWCGVKLDFVNVDTQLPLLRYLACVQASTLSEYVLRGSFVSDKGISGFRLEVRALTATATAIRNFLQPENLKQGDFDVLSNIARLNTHVSMCTPNHRKKIVAVAKELGLQLMLEAVGADEITERVEKNERHSPGLTY